MGRRSFISTTTINRIISASRAAKKRQENNRLISANSSALKELAPTYTLDNVEFNNQSRIAKLTFEKLVQYRTVERYVQRNYERYPIYSNWKTKRTFLHKSIKLTNAALESLNTNTDNLIREYAFEIITWLKNPDLFPSWFYRKCIDDEFKQKNLEQQAIKTQAEKIYKEIVSSSKKSISQNLMNITNIEKENFKLDNKIKNISNKIERIKNHKKSLFLTIITFSIYYYLGSQRRLNKLSSKERTAFDTMQQNKAKITNLKNENNNYEQKIQQKKFELSKVETEVSLAIATNKREQENRIKEIVPLPMSFEPNIDTGFVPLKSIGGLEYKKIIGCYIIRNRLNQHCYVGQSKDVIKRIRQHFKGTYPNNIIFAEDYFAAKEIERNDMFELKIIPCTTKDELDRTEKNLIEEYDAFKSGYNGTNGNQ